MPTKCIQNTSCSNEIWGSHSVVLLRIQVRIQLRNVCRVKHFCKIHLFNYWKIKRLNTTSEHKDIYFIHHTPPDWNMHKDAGKNADVCYFHLFCGSQIVTCSWTDMVKLTGTFLQLFLVNMLQRRVKRKLFKLQWSNTCSSTMNCFGKASKYRPYYQFKRDKASVNFC